MSPAFIDYRKIITFHVQIQCDTSLSHLCDAFRLILLNNVKISDATNLFSRITDHY
jgi:hypothetical protein